MMMKVFPHGTGQGDKPTKYLVRMDYPGRDTAPPLVLRGDPALTRALIDSIDRRWKFTAGVLSWHPDDKVSEEKEQEVMDAFEEVAFAGLAPDQRNILWKNTRIILSSSTARPGQRKASSKMAKCSGKCWKCLNDG